MNDKKSFSTDEAPTPASNFSQGVAKNGLLQISGQGPVDPSTGQYIAENSVKAQTHQVLANIKAILDYAGASVEDVLMFRVYLTDRDDFASMNDAYCEFVEANVISGKPPARTTVFVGLPYDVMRVEIDALAVTN